MCGFPDPDVFRRFAEELSRMWVAAQPIVRFEDDQEVDWKIGETARAIAGGEDAPAFCRGIVVADGPIEGRKPKP